MSRNKAKLQPTKSDYQAELIECKKQFEITMTLNQKKQYKRNGLKSSSISEQFKTGPPRSRNLAKGKTLYHTNTATSQNTDLGSKRVSGAFMSNYNIPKKKTQVYKRLSHQRDTLISNPANKENSQNNSNKNIMRLSRNSLGNGKSMKNNIYHTSNNLSSTGAYNSITKNPKEIARPATATKMASKIRKNKSTRSKPVYQICETGASVDNYSKASHTNGETSFSCNDFSGEAYDAPEVSSNVIVVERQSSQPFAYQEVRPRNYEVPKPQTGYVIRETINNCNSENSSISDSAVSEGSLVVQNLPASRIINATKKSSDVVIPSYKKIKAQRKDYIIAQNSYPTKYHKKDIKAKPTYEFSKKEEFLNVGSSSDSSDGFDDSMEVEIEIENFSHNQPVTTTNKLAKTQQFIGFASTSKGKFKFDEKYQRKSTDCKPAILNKEAWNKKTINYKLRLAVEKGDISTLKKILKMYSSSKAACIDLNNQRQDQWTLLHIATNEGNYSIVKLLLEYGSDPNIQAVNQRTSLHLACMRGHPSIVKILLDNGADINIADMDGNTPIHFCSEFGRLCLVKYLAHSDLLRYILTKKPTLYVLNKYGKSPVDVAANNEILKIFDEHLSQIKHELIHNIAQMNGLVMSNKEPQTHRTKLISIHDSLLTPGDEFEKCATEMTEREARQGKLAPERSKHFHPELTKKYKFKEGKYVIQSMNEDPEEEQKHDTSDHTEIIGPKSFVPIMVLGKGSFGEVYLVQKVNTKKFYAMKVLQKNKLMGQNLVKYARTERNVLSYTKHTFIVGLNYAFQTKEKLFLILDY